jgi:hypothetical protein
LAFAVAFFLSFPNRGEGNLLLAFNSQLIADSSKLNNDPFAFAFLFAILCLPSEVRTRASASLRGTTPSANGAPYISLGRSPRNQAAPQALPLCRRLERSPKGGATELPSSARHDIKDWRDSPEILSTPQTP